MNNEVKYKAKIKGQSEEMLDEKLIAEFFHFFTKEEIEYVEEIKK
jgi:hypothetical protein